MRTSFTPFPNSCTRVAVTNAVDPAARWQPLWVDAIAPSLDVVPELADERYRDALSRVARRADDALALSIRLPFCAVHCLCCMRTAELLHTDSCMTNRTSHQSWADSCAGG